MPVPGWVESGAAEISGLDLLGLRAPVMRIGNALLDGITTITPSVRYLSFITWVTWLYWKHSGIDKRKSYLEFARRVEAAIGLGNLAFDSEVTGLIGADGARDALDDPTGVPLNIKVLALASNVYSGPAEQLGLLATQGDAEVPHLTRQRGLPMAEAIDTALRATALGRQLSDGELPERVPREVLRAFGEVAHMRSFADAEREILLDALLPTAPRSPIERNRLMSYTAFLARAAKGQVSREYRAILATAISTKRELANVLEDVLDGWVLYLVRDSLAVAHEHALAALIDGLPRPENGGPVWVAPVDVVRAALRDAASLEAVLQDLDLLSPGEPWESLTFRELEARVKRATTDAETVERGLRRWVGGITEEDLIRVTMRSGAGAPVTLPIAWLLAARRAGPGLAERMPEFAALSREGHSRLGMEQAIVPAIERFRRADLPLADVVAELLTWTVEQHLRTAWARLAVDPRKDVALLLVDGNRWAYRKDYRPGQTDDRLRQVDNWLRQLGLRDGEALTDLGRQTLERGLKVLAQHPST